MAPVVKITYPAELPVSARRDDIAAAIRDHQVVIVAGETGSGKTTQLPKICLELGRGLGSAGGGKLIGHTQPRRIAARSVAERIAEELGTELGDVVGYQVRFTDRTSRASRVKLMTDGILLAELQRDRDLRKYDTIIIDEAHERSLNIDFLLGYLRRLLPRRPDLKVIITSATIDVDRFAAHFRAPVVEVSGRTYPVEVRYRPLLELPESDEDGDPVQRDQTEAILDAVRELSAEGPGDVLVFLPGEREIRDTADAFDALKSDRLEIVPLYSRLSAADQHKVFSSHSSIVRRVVLATNVAETSLTVPGIRYVVDTGVARISRYSVRTKVQRLPIEPISQASANQRSGRCGRVVGGHRDPAVLARRTSRRARSSPTRRSCAPTSPASSSRWPPSGSATSPASRSSSRPTAATSRPAPTSSRSSARSRPLPIRSVMRILGPDRGSP